MRAFIAALTFLFACLAAFGQSAPVTFDTITALTNTTPSKITTGGKGTFSVRGHTRAGDSGGGELHYSSTASNAPDGLVYYMPSNHVGRFIRTDTANLSVRMAGAQLDGTNDETVIIQAALDTVKSLGLGKLVLSEGIALVSGFNVPEGVTFEGLGKASRLVLNSGPATNYFDYHPLYARGETNGTPTALTADAVESATNITVASASGIATGTHLLIWDNQFRVLPPDIQGTNCNLVQVRSVSGNIVELETPLPHNYLVASNAFVDIVTNAGPRTIRNMDIEVPLTYYGGGIIIRNAYGVVVDGVEVSGNNDDPAIKVQRSTGVTIRNCNIHDGQTMTSGYGYGIEVSDCSHDVEVYGNRSSGIREHLVGGGATLVNWHHNRQIGDVYGINTHASGTKDITIAYNVLSDLIGSGLSIGFGTGADQGDARVRIIGNEIVRAQSHGIVVNAAAASSFNSPFEWELSGNYIYSVGRGPVQAFPILINNTSRGKVHNNTINNTNSLGNDEHIAIINSSDIVVSDNTIVPSGSLPATYGISWTSSTNITIERNWVGNTTGAPFRSKDTNSVNVILRDNFAELNNPPAYADAMQVGNRYGTDQPTSQFFRVGNGAASFTIPIRVQQATNSFQYIQNINLSDGVNGVAGLSLSSGTGTNSSSGVTLAYSGTAAPAHYRDKFGLVANSDAIGLFLSAIQPGQIFEVLAGSASWPALSISNGITHLRNSGFGFGNNPTALLQMDTTNATLVPPRMTRGQALTNINQPTLFTGSLYYDTSSNKFMVYNGSQWTNVGPVSLYAGANVTISPMADGLEIASSGGGSGATNGTAVYSGDTFLSDVELTDSSEINVSLTGTNASWALIDGTITTNRINTTFYDWVLSMAGGGGGGSGTNLFLNDVLLQPAKLTNSPSLTGGLVWLTNADGDFYGYATNISGVGTGAVVRVNAGASIPDASFDSSSFISFAESSGSITAAVVSASLRTNEISPAFYNWIDSHGGSGGGGLGTNAFVNGLLTQPLMLTNAAALTGGVVWLTNANGSTTAYATNISVSGGTNVGSLLQVLGGAYLYLTNSVLASELGPHSYFGIVTNVTVTAGSSVTMAKLTVALDAGLTSTNYQVMFTAEGRQEDGIPVMSILQTYQGLSEVRLLVSYSGAGAAPDIQKLIFWIVDYNGVASIVSGGGGTGDVAGPGSSTDNAVVRWDGTAGTSVQNSTVRIQDDGAIIINTNTVANPRLTFFGTNTQVNTVQSGYLEVKEFPATGSDNVTLGANVGSNADNSPNVRVLVNWYSPTNANPHIGLNVGDTAYSSFVVKRRTASGGGGSFIGLRGTNYLTGTDGTEEFQIDMKPTGAELKTLKGYMLVQPFDGVTRLEGAAAPVNPTTGEGLEVWYDTDDTSFGGSGRTDLISYDRTANLWGAIRLSGTNIIVRRGTTVALQVDNSANVLIPQTNFVGELLVTNGITLGGTRRTTWPTGTTPTYESLPSVPSSATNHVLDFGFSALTYSVTNNVNLLQSTNRPGNATNVLYSVMRLAGDTVDRTLSWHASWKRLGTNITTIPSNKVVVVSAMCIGTDETGVTFGVAKEE